MTSSGAMMTPEQIVQWRSTLGWSKRRAADELGVSYAMYRWYEAGEREGRPVEIPRPVALACSALLHRLPPYGE